MYDGLHSSGGRWWKERAIESQLVSRPAQLTGLDTGSVLLVDVCLARSGHGPAQKKLARIRANLRAGTPEMEVHGDFATNVNVTASSAVLVDVAVRLSSTMRGLPFPTNALFDPDHASEHGTPSRNLDDIPIDPALAAPPAVGPARPTDRNLHPLYQVCPSCQRRHRPADERVACCRACLPSHCSPNTSTAASRPRPAPVFPASAEALFPRTAQVRPGAPG